MSTPERHSESPAQVLRRLWPLVAHERKRLLLALVAMLCNASLNLLAPVLVAHTIDTAIQGGDYPAVLRAGGGLMLLYLGGLIAAYWQTMLMGTVGQRVLFGLRERIFTKLQSLPVAFFNRHKSGDLISRINNDTDKLNQFLSESLVRFIGNLFIMAGAAVFMLVLNLRLGLVALAPTLLLWGLTQVLSPWVRRRNAESLKRVGALSAQIQESLGHFRVIVAFNRRDYFRERFESANQANYSAAVQAGVANNVFTPFYDLVFQLSQLSVLVMGLLLMGQDALSIGMLIAFLTYLNRFYDPLRQIAMLWASFQLALASWERVSEILNTDEQLPVIAAEPTATPAEIPPLLCFDQVSFRYAEGPEVLRQVNFSLEAGKTYAFVGPTGGGKSTTAALMARLYDPSTGEIRLHGRDLRSYSAAERAARIGFILQDPFLFAGTVRDNLLYGQSSCEGLDAAHLESRLATAGLERLLSRFEAGLETPVSDSMSLGQQQIIAFMRAVLRQPELLILDEATANIDTLTEQLLEEILAQLPASTTRVIIAHRLNTIEGADEIFFVNAGELIPAGSLPQALALLRSEQRAS
ncbi:MAG: ABC transporter ATP-binding protein [Candidatus Sericytochromatia bacterium]